MSTITLNGERVVSGTITIPFYGTWVADVVLATPADIPDAVTLVAGDLTLKGTVVRQATFAASRSARIVGGAAGWRKTLHARGYSHLAGVKLSSVLGDAARESGETIVVQTDRLVGTHYARDEGKAERVLEIELDGKWWIDPSGITRTDARDASLITSPFTVVAWSGGKGQFEIASEAIATWQPGRLFQSATVQSPQTVSSLTIEADNDGKVRLHVLSTDAEKDRLREGLRALIRSELASLSYVGTYDYTVAPPDLTGLVSTIDATPSDSRMPALTNVPLVGTGAVAAPAAGTTCRIRFVNGDPTRPECIALGATTEHLMTTEATALLIYNVLVALMTAAGGGPLLAAVLQPLIVPAILAAMAAQSAPAPPGLIAQGILNATLAGTMASGTTPSNAIGALAAGLSIIDSKTLDVSGFFPGVGVPNG